MYNICILIMMYNNVLYIYITVYMFCIQLYQGSVFYVYSLKWIRIKTLVL